MGEGEGLLRGREGQGQGNGSHGQGVDFWEQRLLRGRSFRWAQVPTERVQGLAQDGVQQPLRSDGRGQLVPGARLLDCQTKGSGLYLIDHGHSRRLLAEDRPSQRAGVYVTAGVGGRRTV